MAESRPVHDPVVLRALAHPVRARILTELSATGSMRAADIARELDVPANQASFHLRQLAKYGLVEEDAAAARDRRDRVWRIAENEPINIDLGRVEKAPGGKAASKVFMRNAAAWAHVVVDAAYAGDRDERLHRSISEDALKLSKAEAQQLQRELTEVVRTWAERTRGAADPDRSTYHLFTILQPYPDLP